MQPHHLLWSTIIGYMLLAISISIITSLWIRHHLKNLEKGAYCVLILPSSYCVLNEKHLTVEKTYNIS